MQLPYIPTGWGITGILILFIIGAGLYMRRKKAAKGGLIVLAFIILALGAMLYSNAGTEVYIIGPDFQATETMIHGQTDMKLKFFTYKLDPVPGNVIVINRSMCTLYIKQICYAEPSGKWENIPVKPGEAKNIPVSNISYFPNDVPPQVQTFTVGSPHIQYQVSKDNY